MQVSTTLSRTYKGNILKIESIAMIAVLSHTDSKDDISTASDKLVKRVVSPARFDIFPAWCN